MRDLCRLIWCAMVGLVRSRAALQDEFLVLRHQLNVLRRQSPKRAAVDNIDRLPKVLDALKVLNPATAPRGFPAVMAPEVTVVRRPTKDARGLRRCPQNRINVRLALLGGLPAI
jgi:hypothetical protein